MKLKKFILTGLAVSIFSALGSPVFAEDINNSTLNIAPIEAVQTLDLQNGLQNLPDGVKVSEVLTFDELASQMAKDQGITENEASSIIINNRVTANRMSIESTEMAARLATYRTLSKKITKWSNYQPSMTFYCETSEGNGFHGIIKIIYTDMDRSWGNSSKGFGGTVNVNLENASKIHFIVNGDFFNNSTSTVGFNAEIGVGESASIGFNASSTTNHFGYMFHIDDLYWY